jgi:hypothetical protein
MDLFELFERDAPARDRDPAQPPRKGLRGWFDRLVAAFDGDGDDDSRRDRRHDRDRRRDSADLDFD